ncbi:MAG TPA: PRTRC system protein D [Terriglobales bacterium]|nr:PRTRC system protein D [Terriglobales bacterium]HTT21695.1 PRTRC system protein D [Candidatus Sulfotelmatobacter sp.]
MNSIVRSIDVGFRNTKLVVAADDRRIECEVFPSIAPTTNGRNLSEAIGRKRNTVSITVEGVDYEVGPDALLAEKPTPTQTMGNDFCLSPEYLALVRGALQRMQVEVVDLLVVGLPVSTFQFRKLDLARRLQGRQPVGVGRTVDVREVKVLTQPHGALIDYALTSGRMDMVRNQRNLIIDCGGRTFDFLVTQAFKVYDQRSDDTKRGMYDVLHVLATEIGQALHTEYTDYEKLDVALRTGTQPLIFGQPYDLEPHLKAARKIPEEAVSYLRRYVEDGSDIDAIILSGGSAFFFRDAICAAFPHHDVHELPEALYANVRGFQQFGMQKLSQAWRRSAASPAATAA